MELGVTDFGPIARAKIDLRPLTVFVGPSNTGKSYLAMLIYALQRYLSVRQFPFRVNADGSLTISSQSPRMMPDDAVNATYELMRAVEEASASPAGGRVPLSDAVSEALRSEFAARADLLADEIKRCFGVADARALVRRARKTSAHVAIRRAGAGDDPALEHALAIGRSPGLEVAIPAGASIPVDHEPETPFGAFDMLRSLPEQASGLSRNMAWLFLASVVLPPYFGPLGWPAYYLPADRTGLMHAHSLVVGGLIASTPSTTVGSEVRPPMLSGVVADFLEQLLEIGGPAPESDLARPIEDAILRGSVRIDRASTTKYARFSYRPHGWREDLALTNASSMVAEVAPVVMYLRHLVSPGNVLIVEEPESHMHPAMQVEFMRQLAVVVKAGVRVIVTTHSEWMTEELGNIVRRSTRPENGREGPALDAEQVGAWLFEPKTRPRGSIVKEIPLDEYGYSGTGFDEVASALHNDWGNATSPTEGPL